ncbi:hypothetical protein PFBG_02787 [Plasmodium falciparum 7G8]|uniref:Exonuclease 1 n=1 Tax=Plasmodium falciparum (isolate 7G8) TaxID=57266 RepID=W7FM56_PLAF8|nr:hypothetical protein PFBG_02787 [Plasmodium falciparum 7G8]
MRVRRLQSYLTENNLLKKSSLENIKNLTLGIDALYFLRICSDLKDILSDVSGCISPCIFHMIDKQCEYFKKWDIKIIFIFDGITPKGHKLFSAHYHQYIDEGWLYYVNDEKKLSQKSFSEVNNICNSDISFLLFHYLKYKGYECIYAPYLAISQLAYFLEINLVDIVFGPPTLGLHNVTKIILNIVWKKNYFEWIDILYLLKMWNINKEQFIDACLLAGTEYCLTFPYLNLSHFNNGYKQFNFGTSIEFIKQSPLICYLQHFPNDELRKSHMNAYCLCKSMLKYPLVFLCTGQVNCFFFHSNKDQNDCSIYNKSSYDKNEEDKFFNNKYNRTITNISTNDCIKLSKDGYLKGDKILDKREEDTEQNYHNSKISYDSYCEQDKKDNTIEHPEVAKEKGKYKNSKLIYEHNSDNSKDRKDTNEDTVMEDSTKHIKDIYAKENYKENDIYKKKNHNNDKENISKLVPKDYIKVVGAKFPTCVYYLMSIGLLSKKLLCVLAMGEWIDYSHPIIDSFEYRDTLIDLREYRCRILGLVSIKLNPFFYKRKVKFFDYGYYINNIMDKDNKATYLNILFNDNFLWKINKDNVSEEMNRQNVKNVDLQFVLRWHLYSESKSISLVAKKCELYDEDMKERKASNDKEKDIYELESSNDNNRGHNNNSDDNNGGDNNNDDDYNNYSDYCKKSNEHTKRKKKYMHYNKHMIYKYNSYYKNILRTNNQNFHSFLCLVYFMFLENLDIFTKNCGVTLFGLLLSEVKNKNIDSNILIIFELFKFGFLTTEALLPPDGKTYPENAYASIQNNNKLDEQDKKSVLLLSRIYSLYNSNIDHSRTYEGLIDFDLCAFFAVVKIIKKTLRQLLQACVTNVLLTNMELIHILPENLYNPFDIHICGFFVTNHFMGVLIKYFLLFDFDDIQNEKETLKRTSDKNMESNKMNNDIETMNDHLLKDKLENQKETEHLSKNNDFKGYDMTTNNHISITQPNKKNNDHINMKEINDKFYTNEQPEDKHMKVDKNQKYGINQVEHKDKRSLIELENNDKNIIYKENYNENGNNSYVYSDEHNLSDDSKTNNYEATHKKHENNLDHKKKEEYKIDEEYCQTPINDDSQNNFNVFEKAIRKKFPSFVNPINDLCNAINTWRDHLCLITQLEQHTNVYDLVSDLKAADNFLEKKISYIGLDKSQTYNRICLSNNK